MSIPLHIIILAAGDGTRMKSRMAKVLHPVGGRPMIEHVLGAAEALNPEAIHLVFNPEAADVRERCAGRTVNWVPQTERRGTGHAVMQAIPGIPDDVDVLVLYGDTPLVPPDLLRSLIESPQPMSLLTMELADPAGYGRVVREADGRIVAVVEDRDANDARRSIREVNSGILKARAGDLRRWLGRSGDANAQGEHYLTDVFSAAADDGVEIGSERAPDPTLLEGANDRVQLARLETRHRRLKAEEAMRDGVMIADPQRVDLRGTMKAGRDVVLDVNVVLEGEVRLGDGTSIGVGCVVRDCNLAAGTRVHPYSVLEGVRTTGPCDIGPFARLRPGTVLEAGTRVGNFVEVKNASLGEGSKASHLSYLGDTTIGREVNIGAGTITCNYDGVDKHRTVIGDRAFIGSDTQLVAPVEVGEDATVGAGTTLTRDAPAGQLTVSRARQTTVSGWKRPRKKDA